MNDCLPNSDWCAVREDGSRPVGSGRCERNGRSHYFTRQAISEFITGGVASTLMERQYKSPDDLVVEESEGGDDYTTSRDTILQVLQKAYGEEAVLQWGTGMLELLQQTGVLQHGLSESEFSPEGRGRKELECYAQLCSSTKGRELLRKMRENRENRCASCGYEPAKQSPGKFDEALPELSSKNAQDAEDLLTMWGSGERLGLLRQALHSIQEIRRPSKNGLSSISGRTQMKRKYIVRRLTPLETCRLQGFPDWWEDGANGSDAARYKMYGNAIALPCAIDVLARIEEAFNETDR